MHTFLLQDWVTLRGSGSSSPVISSLTQSEDGYLDMSGYSDVVVWFDVKDVVLGTGMTGITLDFQTAPTKDDAYFRAMATGISLTASSPSATPGVFLALMNSASIPVSRWLRWKLTAAGTPSTAWSVTIRMFVSASGSAGFVGGGR